MSDVGSTLTPPGLPLRDPPRMAGSYGVSLNDPVFGISPGGIPCENPGHRRYALQPFSLRGVPPMLLIVAPLAPFLVFVPWHFLLFLRDFCSCIWKPKGLLVASVEHRTKLAMAAASASSTLSVSW